MSASTTSRATIHGGAVSANLDDFARLCGLLNQSAHDTTVLSGLWSTGAAQTSLDSAAMKSCIVCAAQSNGQESKNSDAVTRADGLARTFADTATDLTAISATYSDLSDLLARAQSLYSNADDAMSNMLSMLIGIGGVTVGGPFSLMATGVLGGAAWLAGGGNAGAAKALHASDAFQEGILTSLANTINVNLGGSPMSSSPVNDAAGRIATLSAPLEALLMGNKLVVSQPHPSKDPVKASATVSDALANLDALTAQGSGVDYGTVAVQKYVDAEGNSRWLVLIPGTDTHWDTAVGWGQNIELMSSNNAQRMQADSARLVVEAMKRSGIGADEPVTLVGHSQGGIVAATVAAGLEKQYNITHIVTAGSPIANHPVPGKTWVTSIENKGELVSNLDGERNPARSNWVTVRGDIDVGNPPSTPIEGTAANVGNAPGHTDITHAMNYQRATWQNAKDMGSAAVEESDEHFEEQIQGNLASTSYYTGRMTH
jgi:hypothetical protein